MTRADFEATIIHYIYPHGERRRAFCGVEMEGLMQTQRWTTFPSSVTCQTCLVELAAFA